MITIIVAMDEDRLIGKKDSSNGMPWVNKEDLKHFRNTTVGKTILMGSTTYLAIGRPLPKRKTIVVSYDDFEDDRIEIRKDLIEVLEEYKGEDKELYISGGASIYKQSLPYADRLWISRIPGHHEGETYFPDYDGYGYVLKEEVPFETFTLEKWEK